MTTTGAAPSSAGCVTTGWLRPSAVPTGCGMLMTTRHGGRSSGVFASMNSSLDVGDDAVAVAANRSLLRAAIGAEPVFLRQVHSKSVVRFDAGDVGAPPRQADASITDVPGLACVVQVADCLPVLFATRDGRAVGAAHAGWRGLAAGVLEATVLGLCDLGRCAPGDLVAWLGACIGHHSFEVGADVLAAFGIAGADRRFIATRPGKWLADLPGLARDRLQAVGVIDLSGGSWDTVAEPSQFFSYRRDGVTGRMAAAVWIEAGRG